MYIDLKYNPGEIKRPTYCTVLIDNVEFPALFINKDSYIVSARIETTIDFHLNDKLYNLQIGKYSSLAEDIVFMIDMDHDYMSVFQGVISEYNGYKKGFRKERRGEIIIQNDCWIGHAATIMGGVTIHNGAIVAANSVVTKDVPPYTIVGGNPAKPIKKRFSDDVVSSLLKIRWWDWSQNELRLNQNDMFGNVDEFVNKYFKDAESLFVHRISKDPYFQRLITEGQIYCFCVDTNVRYPIFSKIISLFCKRFNSFNAQLVLYFSNTLKKKDKSIKDVIDVLDTYKDLECCVSLVYDPDSSIESVINNSDVYITNSDETNIYNMEVAYLLNKKMISGFKSPLFD